MNKHKTISSFNQWFSSIDLNKLSIEAKQAIKEFDAYRKKLTFETVLKLYLYGINEEKVSLSA